MKPAMFTRALIVVLLLVGASQAAPAQQGDIVWVRGGHTGVVNSIAFSPTAPVLASAGDDRTIRLWDPETGAVLRTLGLKSAANCIAFTRDGTRLLAGCYDGMVRILDATTLALISTHRAHGSIVYSISVTADGSRYATSGESVVSMWDGATSALVRTLTGHTTTVKAAAISPDGRYVVSGGTDYTVRLWDAESGALIHNFVEIMRSASAVAFSPDSRQFAVRGYAMDRDTFSVNVYSAPECTPIISFDVQQRKEILGLAFSPDGSGVASVSMDFLPHLIGKEFNTVEVRSIRGSRGKWIVRDSIEGSCVAFSPDERWLAYGSYGGWIGVARRCPDTTCWVRDTMRRITDYAGAVEALALSHDERMIAVGADDGHLDLRNVATGALIRRLTGHHKPVRSISFTHDDTRLASAGVDGMVKIWETATGNLQRRLFLSPAAVVRSVCFLGGGRSVAGALGPPDSAIVFLDTNSNEIRARLTSGAGGVNAIALTADGSLLIAGGDDGAVRTWDVASGREVGSPAQFDRPVLAVATLDNDLFVSGTDDGRLALTELGSSWPLWETTAHRRAVTAVAFSRDGSLVGTCSLDSTVKIWRVEAEGLALVREYTDFPFGHHALALAADSGLVLCGATNATVLARRLADPAGMPPTYVAASPRARLRPNPVQSSAILTFASDRSGRCSVRFFDLLGRRAPLTVESDLPAGTHRLPISIATLAPALWVLELQTPTGSERLRMVVAGR